MAASDRKTGVILRACRDAMPVGVYTQSIGKRRRGERKAPPAIVWIAKGGPWEPPSSQAPVNQARALVDRVVQFDVEIYSAQPDNDTDDESLDYDTADEAIADVTRAVKATIRGGALGWIGENWDGSHGSVEDGYLTTVSFTVRIQVTEATPLHAPVNTRNVNPHLQISGEL